MPARSVVSALALATVAACAPVPPTEEFVSKAPAARVVGEPQDCILRRNIRVQRVHDDRTIDFEMGGGKVFRNTLPYACPRLSFDEAFLYRADGARICNRDIIYALERVGGDYQQGAGCGLGEFVPIEYLDRGGID